MIIFPYLCEQETNLPMRDYKFKVWIDGNYYYDDMEYDVEIELSDDEVATIKNLVSEYDNDLSQGIMHVLKQGHNALYNKFYRAIAPEVFMEYFSRDDMFEPLPGDEDKQWTIDDFDYLVETYHDGHFDCDEAYIVRIPDEMMPPKIHFSKGMSKEEILKYIRRWSHLRNNIFDNIYCYHPVHDATDKTEILELIEKRLLALAEDAIFQNDEETLAEDDFDPFEGINIYYDHSITDEILDEFKKRRK